MNWISVKDLMPKEGLSVLIWNGAVHKTCRYSGDWLLPSDREAIAVTHWMPLPPPPAKDAEP